MKSPFRVVVHGSLRKHLKEMGLAIGAFRNAGIEVLAPDLSPIVAEEDGFLFFKGEERQDPRLIELLYLQNLKRLGPNGFSYFVNPNGYIGKSVSYELGITHATNVPCFFSHKLADHPAFIGTDSVWSPESLAAFIQNRNEFPINALSSNQDSSHAKITKLWKNLIVPGSVVTTGGIIEYAGGRDTEREVLLVKTHKWGHRFSIVGGKVKRRERLDDALRREVKEETGLDGIIGRHLCTFDEIRHSGYYDTSVQHVFVDHVVRVDRKHVILNDEAQEYLWLPARHALTELPLEPNARHTLELYASQISRSK